MDRRNKSRNNLSYLEILEQYNPLGKEEFNKALYTFFIKNQIVSKFKHFYNHYINTLSPSYKKSIFKIIKSNRLISILHNPGSYVIRLISKSNNEQGSNQRKSVTSRKYLFETKESVKTKIDNKSPNKKFNTQKSPLKDQTATTKNKKKKKYKIKIGNLSNIFRLVASIRTGVNKSNNKRQLLRKAKKARKIDKNSENIAIGFYSDHSLTMATLNINPKNEITITAAAEVPIPGHVIGDKLVEDINEFANIIVDMTRILKLNNPPLLIILGSSFFKVNSFESSELRELSSNDIKVQSKSPYLQSDSLIDFESMTNKTSRLKFYRAIYSQKTAIDSWVNAMKLTNLPIIAITPAALHIFDSLVLKVKDKLVILIDIEVTSTTILIGKKNSNLNSYKLPFGSSLYETEELMNSYFLRALNSIKQILLEEDEALKSKIYVIGQGLDHLLKNGTTIPSEFLAVSELNLFKYEYSPDQMKIHEIVSNSISSRLSIASCVLEKCL